jgi:hypothetical protein
MVTRALASQANVYGNIPYSEYKWRTISLLPWKMVRISPSRAHKKANMIIDELFSLIYGKFCWDAAKGYGSFLTFEFGEPHLVIDERFRLKDGIREKRRRVAVHGDWHLWIYLCNWKIISHDTVKATHGSSTRDIVRAMQRLDGQALTRVEVHPDGSTTFLFELNDRLETTPNIEYGPDADQWLLFQPSKMVFTLRADRKYHHQPGNTEPKDYQWQSLD